jgi:hypothetical protein
MYIAGKLSSGRVPRGIQIVKRNDDLRNPTAGYTKTGERIPKLVGGAR